VDISNREFIEMAASVIKPKQVGNCHLIGDVGAALLANNGKVYLGVCADIGVQSFCAETNAIGAMLTDGECLIKRIVATWKDKNGDVYVIPPCGHCREFMCQVNIENLDNTEVVLDQNKVVKLKDLYPYHGRGNFKKRIFN